MNRKLLAAMIGTMCYEQVTEQGSGGGGAPSTPAAVVDSAVAEQEKAKLHTSIAAKFDNKVDVKEVKFHFKKTAVEIDGKPTGDFTKRPTVELALPVPSVEGIISILENGESKPKELALLLEAVQEVVIARARDIVNEKEDITQENIDLTQMSWETIANLPKAERRGGGISKDVWEDFAKDYIAVMPAVTGKTAEQVGNAAKILLQKFNPVKTVKPVLKLLKDQLGLYVVNSPNAETFQECVQFLTEKADNLINFDESKLLNNL